MLPEFIDSLRQMEIILKDGSYYEIEKEDLIAWSWTCKDCNVIFDVGCRTDSIYLDFTGEVHYFDPDSNFIKNIKTIKNSNKSAYFNEFGLSKITEIKNYYPAKQSFTWKVGNPIKLPLKKGSEYVIEKNIKTIDFLKIDTEGSEFDIIKGFGNFLNNS